MINNTFCCPYCFDNKYIRQYIEEIHDKEGVCPYCKKSDVPLVSLEKMEIYLRGCIEKAYDCIDDGTGAMYDSEDKMYIGPYGEEAITYSIRDILEDSEMIFTDESIGTSLLDDLFENKYSERDRQKGAVDIFDDVDSQVWVTKDDLYGIEQTRIFHAWETFKHIIKTLQPFF